MNKKLKNREVLFIVLIEYRKHLGARKKTLRYGKTSIILKKSVFLVINLRNSIPYYINTCLTTEYSRKKMDMKKCNFRK